MREIESLHEIIRSQREAYRALEERCRLLEEENRSLREENRLLKEENSVLKAQHQVLQNRVVELERRLGLNSSTSSKPPSSDGLHKKKRHRSLRSKGKKASGGQVGHPGQTLQQTDKPDVVVGHPLLKCPTCASNLQEVPLSSVIKRQVFDIPPPQVVVTEHQAQVKRCKHCKRMVSAAFPAGVWAPTQYGDRVKTLAVYLQHQQLIPEDRLQELFQDVFQLPISTQTLATIGENFSSQLAYFAQGTLQYLQQAAVKNADETGLHIEAQTQWMHTLSNTFATYYRISPKRGAMTPGIRGILVHDHFKPYYGLRGVKHALCNAHHLRELKALEEIEKEPWAFQMSSLLRIVRKYSAKAQSPPPHVMKRIKALYERIIGEGIQYHASLPAFAKEGSRKKRPGLNLLIRLHDFKEDVLRCLHDPAVPFTNNQAEQDIRMVKVKQKISGGFRTTQGAQIFCVIRGFLSTMRKQNRNLFEAIEAAWGGQCLTPC